MSRRYLISGQVQGVGFRFFARRRALELGISGWVRNLPDGGVEVLAEGSREELDAFEAILRQGPTAGRVDGFAASENSDELDPSNGFTIR